MEELERYLITEEQIQMLNQKQANLKLLGPEETSPPHGHPHGGHYSCPHKGPDGAHCLGPSWPPLCTRSALASQAWSAIPFHCPRDSGEVSLHPDRTMGQRVCWEFLLQKELAMHQGKEGLMF